MIGNNFREATKNTKSTKESGGAGGTREESGQQLRGQEWVTGKRMGGRVRMALAKAVNGRDANIMGNCRVFYNLAYWNEGWRKGFGEGR